MRPLKLTMQAFGPYANKQEVDFTKLGEKTMFVISGATGAGKTTIFDGISFAIYGKASGDDRAGNDLRSQFASDDLLTEVTLEFQLRNKRYLIKRNPQQEKKKSRGEGTTVQSAKAELYALGEEETLLAANVRDVDDKINEIMKIDCHQFRQIMMIPQGEFRKLLVSESKDKEKILQKLFHTEHYKRIEEILKDRANELRKEVERGVGERNTFLSRIQADNNEKLLEVLSEDHINVNDVLERLKELISEDEKILNSISADIKSNEEKRQMIEREIHHGNHIVEQIKVKEQLFIQKEQLQSCVPEIEAVTKTIDLAKKAANLSQYEQQCNETELQMITKQQELKNANVLLEKLANELREKEAKLIEEKQRSDEREELHQEINHLKALEKDILSFATVEKEVDDLKNEINNLTKNKDHLEKQMTLLDEKIEALLTEKEAVNSAQLEKADLSMKLMKDESMAEKVSDLIKNKKNLITLEKHFSATEDDREDIEDDLSELNEHLEQLLSAWNKGQAALLAKKLSKDEPCPVCGSNHHPDRAEMHDDIPTEEELKQIQNKVKQLEQEKQKLDSTYYEAKSQFETHMNSVIALADSVSEKLPYQLRNLALEDLQEYFEEQCCNLKNQLKQLDEKVSKKTEIESNLEAANTEKNQLKESLNRLNEQFENKHTSFIEKRRDLARLSEIIPESLRDAVVFRKKLSEVENKLKLIERALEQAEKAVIETKRNIATIEGTTASLQKVVNELKERLVKLQKTFEEQLSVLGFSSKIDYGEAKRTEIEVSQLEANVQSFREELRSVTDRYTELHARLEAVEKPDLQKLEEIIANVNQQLHELQERKNVLYHKCQTNSNIYASIEKINQEIAKVEEQFKIVGELSDIASGKNTYKLTFERFVLAAFLDEILVCANARLNKMTSGRYQLQRKTDRSKGNIQSGLELLVFDQYTGKTRHVKTLSGGESFKASLSLALGLADIVQSFSGGISMETMFIDEGFGTLDPESLENAIETLVEIQSTGRLVGIISHVPELKERIDARFEVISTQTGSIVKYFDNTVSM